MNRKTAVALVIFIALGIVAYLVLQEPPKGQRMGERPRPLPAIAAGDIAAVTLAEKNKPKITLQREGDSWQLVEPVKYAADQHAAKTLSEKLEKLEFGDLVTERKDRHGLHQVDEASGVTVTVAGKGGKQLVAFIVGKAESGFTMLRPVGKDAVYQAVGSLRFVFSKDIKSWRDRTILSLKQDEVTALRSVTAAGDIALSRSDAKSAWKVQQSSQPVDQLDAEVPRALLSTAASLSAFDFVDGASAAKTGLDKPQATLTLTLPKGKDQRLLIGNKENDSYYVKRGDGEQVFLIKQFTADNLIKRPIDFRDKTILSFKADDLVELRLTQHEAGNNQLATLTRKGSDWFKDGKKLAADGQKLTQAAQALAGLKADRFAQHSADELGMAKPGWIVALKLKDRTQHTLTVGAKDQDGFFGVLKKGVADLFACRKYKLDRFLLNAAELK